MEIKRVVPNIQSDHLEQSRKFYRDFLGFEVLMDMDWIVTFVSGSNSTAQLSLITSDMTAPVFADVSIEVEDVDQLYAQAVRCGFKIVYPITNEPWGVRRFFVQDPNGQIVNILTHL